MGECCWPQNANWYVEVIFETYGDVDYDGWYACDKHLESERDVRAQYAQHKHIILEYTEQEIIRD